MSTSLPTHAPRRRRWLRRLLLVLGGGLLLALLLVAVAYARTEVPAPDEQATAAVTRVLYSDGSEMGRVGDQNRILTTIDKVPADVREAVLTAEDRGFYTEPGISPRGIARALLTNVRGGGEIQQGGSTITQQYAKNAFLTSERTYTRKVKEILIAVKMTRQVPKDQILEDYLNTIFFGRGAAGIEVASNTYFGKPVDQMTTAEGAVLAALIRSPANYDPERFPERARERWEFVLDGMVEQGWLDAGERATLEYPAVRPAAEADRNNDLSGPKGHVIAKVLAELEIELEERDLGASQAGGLDVTSTVSRVAQDAAVAAVQDVVGDQGEQGSVQGALVAVDPRNGGVQAYYGGATGTGFDYASQGNGRPAGSSFKPYVLAAALEEGIGLRSTFDGNSPKDFRGIPRPIRNFGDRDFGRVDLVRATQNSVNTAYFELGLEVGPRQVAELAERVGISSPLGDGAPEGGISLGIYDVRVLDQAVAYGTFAANGTRAAPHFIRSVSQGGELLFEVAPELTEVLDPDVAADATSALQAVVDSGTGTRAQLPGRDVAGKTGTTSENTDTWFVGYTPQLSVAVWIGTGASETIELEGVNEVTGGVVNAGIWRAFAVDALEGQDVLRFPRAANVGRQVGGSSSSTTAPRPRPPAPTTQAPPSAAPEPVETEAPEPQEPSEPEQSEPDPPQQPATPQAVPQQSAPAAPEQPAPSLAG